MVVIKAPFLLHNAQMEIFKSSARFRVACNGRRFGKTALGVVSLVIKGIGYKGTVDPKFPVTVLGILPTANQARSVIWKPLYNLCTSEPYKLLIKPGGINRTSMTVDLINGVQIRIAGANDSGGDRLRGLKVYFAWFDEMQDIKPIAWEEVVRPALSDTPNSSALFTGTPKGKSNILYDLAMKAETMPDWAYFNYPTAANPVIPRDEIEQARASLPDRLFRQEYLADFVSFPGKIYSELDQDNKHFGDLPRLNLVVAGIDPGDLYGSISIIGRGIDRKWYYLEGYQPNMDARQPQPIPLPVFHANFKRLVKKWTVNNTYVDPSRPSDILGIRALGSESGYQNAVQGFNRISEGCDQIHSLIKQKNLLFTAGLHDKVEGAFDGLQAYTYHESYHRVQDKNGNFTDTVADGIFAHCCDATRYALSTKMGRV